MWKVTRKDILSSGNLYLLQQKLLVSVSRLSLVWRTALASVRPRNLLGENKSINGQKGICAWIAYLVMRNEISRQREREREHARRREKAMEEVRETERMSYRLPQLEERRREWEWERQKTSSRIQNSTSPTRRPFVLPLSTDCSLHRGWER